MTMKQTVWFSLVMVLVGGSVWAGSLDAEQDSWFEHYKKQANVPKPELQLVNGDAEPALTDGFIDLFNGKDLTGWTSKGGRCTFEAKDGAIVGTCVPGSPSTYLCTDRADYGDFLFTCDMKWEVDGNSGVMFRATATGPNDAKAKVSGPQAEMEGLLKGRGWSGGIYGQSCGGWFYPLWLEEHKDVRKALKAGAWNRLTIEARRDTVKTWVNGIPAAHWKTDTYHKGVFGLQMHSGKEGLVHWRGLKVKELK
jgi:hypothetical protein